MRNEESRKYLWDASNAAERIARFIGERDFDDYLENEILRSAVERQFEIMGEALSGLRRVDPDAAATVPDLGRIVAFRNILVHAYAAVDDRLVWGVIESELPKLRAVLDRLLATSAQVPHRRFFLPGDQPKGTAPRSHEPRRDRGGGEWFTEYERRRSFLTGRPARPGRREGTSRSYP